MLKISLDIYQKNPLAIRMYFKTEKKIYVYIYME